MRNTENDKFTPEAVRINYSRELTKSGQRDLAHLLARMILEFIERSDRDQPKPNKKPPTINSAKRT